MTAVISTPLNIHVYVGTCLIQMADKFLNFNIITLFVGIVIFFTYSTIPNGLIIILHNFFSRETFSIISNDIK